MGIVAKDSGGSGGSYEEPPVGIHPAICVDVIDLGEVETPFKIEKGPRAGQPKRAHQIQIVWQLHPMDESGKLLTRTDGKSYRTSKFYTLSLNIKARLRIDLDSWRGKPFTDEELKEGFDVEKLLGAQCQLTLSPVKRKSGQTRVDVVGIAPKHRADPKIRVDPEFVREMDRPGGRDTRSPEAENGSDNPLSGLDETLDDESLDTLPF